MSKGMLAKLTIGFTLMAAGISVMDVGMSYIASSTVLANRTGKNATVLVLIGAGLPRTGTLSTRHALQQVLGGKCYHMQAVAQERPDHHLAWRKSVHHSLSTEEWRELFLDYKAAVDYPASFYYKELLHTFPDAKVLLNMRDPEKWYISVRDSVHKLTEASKKFPSSWLLYLVGASNSLIRDLTDKIPSSSSQGIGLSTAINNGKEAAIKFYHDHVEEVKRVVPKDRLLLWQVKDGWAPLCAFLGIPQPDSDFPWINETQVYNDMQIQMEVSAWLLVVVLPLILMACCLALNLRPISCLVVYGIIVFAARITVLLDNMMKVDRDL